VRPESPAPLVALSVEQGRSGLVGGPASTGTSGTQVSLPDNRAAPPTSAEGNKAMEDTKPPPATSTVGNKTRGPRGRNSANSTPPTSATTESEPTPWSTARR